VCGIPKHTLDYFRYVDGVLRRFPIWVLLWYPTWSAWLRTVSARPEWEPYIVYEEARETVAKMLLPSILSDRLRGRVVIPAERIKEAEPRTCTTAI
jgi:hypothetical protein